MSNSRVGRYATSSSLLALPAPQNISCYLVMFSYPAVVWLFLGRCQQTSLRPRYSTNDRLTTGQRDHVAESNLVIQ